VESKKLCIADLSNIEGRALAWLAGEEWKLRAFREFDAGTGHDLYKLAYARSFGVLPENVTKPQRQIGKVEELALGFAGGVGAFATMAAGYGMDLDAMAAVVLPSAPADLVKQAREFLDWLLKKGSGKVNTFGLADDTFIACDVVKRGWRRGHPAIESWWGVVEQGFRDAVQNPGHTFHCGTVKIRRDGNWLRIQLPSGRHLCYPSPEVADNGDLSYMGVNQYTRKWCRIKTYGGKLAENITQAFARDVLGHSMPMIEAEGYAIVLSVHDELLTETPDTPAFTSDRLSALMSTVPPWAPGLPLAAAGFETHRYKKE
jgi:DNA polymerase